MKLKKGDKIRVMLGRDAGREGVIERIYPKSKTIIVPEINVYKKHMKKSEQMPQGGIIDVPRPLPVSNVALICPHCSSVTRVGYEVKNGTKKRICKKCKTVL